MAWRIYYKKKYLTESFKKEYGESNRKDGKQAEEDPDKDLMPSDIENSRSRDNSKNMRGSAKDLEMSE